VDPGLKEVDDTMKFGFVTSFGSVHDYIIMAREAEAHGWDGIFAWDDIAVGPREVFDPWVTLGAMAAVTSRITLGAMVFSLARRRPWKVARETLTLDNLSNGRLVIPVGLGGTWDGGYARVNTDDPDRKVRAGKMDECLAILALAWTGEPFDYNVKYYQCRDLQFQPPPSSNHASRSGRSAHGRARNRWRVPRSGTASSWPT
jgi:alkanesulfonate monooxygenase SsuD/methylene tetrahydromethanopterin reductase-like flavin-dependent oxidoreductase (luciferase family)